MERLMWKRGLCLVQRLAASSSGRSRNAAMREELWLALDQYAHGFLSDQNDYHKILFRLLLFISELFIKSAETIDQAIHFLSILLVKLFA